MSQTAFDVLQYGAMGLLMIILVAAAGYLRERDKRSEGMIQLIVDRALKSIDSGIAAQQAMGQSLAELCTVLENHAQASDRDHRAILDACQGLARQPLGAAGGGRRATRD